MSFIPSIQNFSLMVVGASTLLAFTTMSTNALANEDMKAKTVKVADSKTVEQMEKIPADTNFQKLDEDNNGKISLKEAAKDKDLFTKFEKSDVNKDGMITSDEYAALVGKTAVN